MIAHRVDGNFVGRDRVRTILPPSRERFSRSVSLRGHQFVTDVTEVVDCVRAFYTFPPKVVFSESARAVVGLEPTLTGWPV